MTSIALVEDFPGYPKDRASFQLLTGTLDEVVDLGVGICNRNSQVVPTPEFVAAYQAGERCLLQIRDWLSAMRRADPRGTIVTARMLAVGAIMRCYLRSSVPAFVDDSELTSRLAALSGVVAAQEYDFVGRIPGVAGRAVSGREGTSEGVTGARALDCFCPCVRSLRRWLDASQQVVNRWHRACRHRRGEGGG